MDLHLIRFCDAFLEGGKEVENDQLILKFKWEYKWQTVVKILKKKIKGNLYFQIARVSTIIQSVVLA